MKVRGSISSRLRCRRRSRPAVPSCTLMLKDYPTLFPNEEERRQAEQLAKKVVHIAEFVARSLHHPPMARAATRTKCVTYHSSCHLRVAGVTEEPRKILFSLPSVNFTEMPDADGALVKQGRIS